MSGTALPTAGRFRFIASDRTGLSVDNVLGVSWRPPNGVRFNAGLTPVKGGTPASYGKVIDNELSLNENLMVKVRDTTAAEK